MITQKPYVSLLLIVIFVIMLSIVLYMFRGLAAIIKMWFLKRKRIQIKKYKEKIVFNRKLK
jgi:hypothetical protein